MQSLNKKNLVICVKETRFIKSISINLFLKINDSII